MARVVVVDPVLTLGCPPKATAGSGMDALSHNAEGALNLRATPFSDALAYKGVELVAQNLRTAVHQGGNIEARWNMSMAALIGGMAIALPWVSGPLCLGHVASESMSSRFGIPHGEVCGVILPFVYWFYLPDSWARKKMAKLAEVMGVDILGLDLIKGFYEFKFGSVSLRKVANGFLTYLLTTRSIIYTLIEL